MELELRSVERQGAHEVGARHRGAGAPSTLVDRVWPPWPSSFASIFYIFRKLSSWIFRSFRELLFLHENNTMAILLKTASVRVSSIQIMQVRVQNKGKIVWKSRYDGDVSRYPAKFPPKFELSNSSHAHKAEESFAMHTIVQSEWSGGTARKVSLHISKILAYGKNNYPHPPSPLPTPFLPDHKSHFPCFLLPSFLPS